MPPPASNQVVVGLSTDDFDGFVEATRGWELDFRPLQPGGGDLVQIEDRGVQATRLRLGPSVLQQGHGPAGFRTFGVMEAGGSVRWC